MGELIEQEMAAAKRALDLARYRLAQYTMLYGVGHRDQDLERRHREALARVRQLEMDAAA